jgi:integrase
MAHASERRLREGVTVAVHRNAGLRKVCDCPRRGWAKCPHPWHFNYSWRGAAYRFSLNRYACKEITGKTEAETLAGAIRREIRAGTFRGLPVATIANPPVNQERDKVSFEMFAHRFVERYSKDRGKASWRDDQYMVKRLGSFPTIEGRPLGEKAIQNVTEDDLEGFIKHLTTQGRTASTRNHYVQLIRAMSRWAVRKGYRDTPMVGDDSDVIRRKKEAQRDRRLEPGEEDKLLRSAGPHLQALIVAALETCGRQGELLNLRWGDVSLARGEIILRAEHTKDRENRILPISSRFRKVLEMRRDSPAGVPLPSYAYVFGDEIGQRVGNVRRAWQTAVLRAHGHQPAWIWKKKTGPNDKGSTRLSRVRGGVSGDQPALPRPPARRRLAPDRGRLACPLRAHMLGHASLQQTSTYLNATLRGLHESMRNLDQSRPACNRLQTHPSADTGLFASRLPPETGSPSYTDCCSWRGRRDSNPRPPA